ncbi:unannotated protein [freshwater metagenome]|uniref:Unannotated protein n=2 Tax=freshwater metagenome TaxID=449393 RepID=A0A6J7I0W5_9ZZZZ
MSSLTVAGARRDGLMLSGTWALDDESVAIIAHLSRFGKSPTTVIAAATRLDLAVVEQLMEELQRAGFVRCRETTPEDRSWVSLVSGRRRVRQDITGVLADLISEDPHAQAVELEGAEDHLITHGVSVRIYRPEGGGADPLPLVLFAHGGGYVTGSIESYDSLCHSMAELSGCAVASVGYRLAPEDPFPAAYDDMVESLRWLIEHHRSLGLDTGRLAVMGDSVGGALANAVAFTAHREGWARVSLMVLIYPALDTTMALPTYTQFPDGPVVSAADMAWFYAHYAAPDHEWTSSPIHNPDLSDAPPSLIITADVDPTRDDGTVYADMLRAAGNESELVNFAGTFHGFMQFAPTLTTASRAQRLVADEIRRRLTGS